MNDESRHCRPEDDARVSAFIDDQLPPEELAEFKEVLRTDPDYQAAVDKLRSVSRAVQSLPRTELGGGFTKRVMDSVAARQVEVGEVGEVSKLSMGATASPARQEDGVDPVRQSRQVGGSGEAQPVRKGRWQKVVYVVAALAAGLLFVILSPSLTPFATVADRGTRRPPPNTAAFGDDAAESSLRELEQEKLSNVKSSESLQWKEESKRFIDPPEAAMPGRDSGLARSSPGEADNDVDGVGQMLMESDFSDEVERLGALAGEIGEADGEREILGAENKFDLASEGRDQVAEAASPMRSASESGKGMRGSDSMGIATPGVRAEKREEAVTAEAKARGFGTSNKFALSIPVDGKQGGTRLQKKLSLDAEVQRHLDFVNGDLFASVESNGRRNLERQLGVGVADEVDGERGRSTGRMAVVSVTSGLAPRDFVAKANANGIQVRFDQNRIAQDGRNWGMNKPGGVGGGGMGGGGVNGIIGAAAASRQGVPGSSVTEVKESESFEVPQSRLRYNSRQAQPMPPATDAPGATDWAGAPPVPDEAPRDAELYNPRTVAADKPNVAAVRGNAYFFSESFPQAGQGFYRDRQNHPDGKLFDEGEKRRDVTRSGVRDVGGLAAEIRESNLTDAQVAADMDVGKDMEMKSEAADGVPSPMENAENASILAAPVDAPTRRLQLKRLKQLEDSGTASESPAGRYVLVEATPDVMKKFVASLGPTPKDWFYFESKDVDAADASAAANTTWEFEQVQSASQVASKRESSVEEKMQRERFRYEAELEKNRVEIKELNSKLKRPSEADRSDPFYDDELEPLDSLGEQLTDDSDLKRKAKYRMALQKQDASEGPPVKHLDDVDQQLQRAAPTSPSSAPVAPPLVRVLFFLPDVVEQP